MIDSFSSDSPIASYWQYLHRACPSLDLTALFTAFADRDWSEWEQPDSAIALNNFAVMALIEAETCSDRDLRTMQLDMAVSALQQGAEMGDYPLCAAHLAQIHLMVGEAETAATIAFSTWMNALQPAFTPADEVTPLGLVYLPPENQPGGMARSQQFTQLLQAKTGYEQALQLSIQTLCRAKQFFYQPDWMRFMHLATHLTPDRVDLNLKLGLSCLINKQGEGLYYLHRAQQLAPHLAAPMQALYLAYRNLEDINAADRWLDVASARYNQQPESPEWAWANLPANCLFTYIPFEHMTLAVEANLQSIVTNILLGEADWVEQEIHFWRKQIQPGMTVIDVGANVGVYAVSAAQRVGAQGRVLAVEPFSGCLQCLTETRRINQLSWLTLCAGAASDRMGTAYLSIHDANELNQIVMDDGSLATTEAVEAITCFTLDSLVEQEKLERVDWLKIDAEGHELQVLLGSDRLLSTYAPAILYENIASSGDSNLEVADFLKSRGYQLFRYQPYLDDLIPLDANADWSGTLNIIALPALP